MKNLVLIGIFLLTAARMSGQTQVLTVDTSGNVTANGAVSGNGLNSQGSAGGQVSISAGSDQLAPASGFSFQAPGTITNGIQVVVPSASSSGLWYGAQWVLPTATAVLSGTSLNHITVNTQGSFMPTAPIVVLNGGGPCNPCATATANMAGTPPFLYVNTISVTPGSLGYTSAPIVSFLGPSTSSPSMVNLLFSPITPNFFVKQSVATTYTPSMPVNSVASEINSAFLPGENVDFQQAYATVVEFPNSSSTGTSMNELASIVVSGNNSNVVTAAASSTTGVIGICVFNCGTTGTAQIAREGVVSCTFDGAATPGDFVQAGSTAGECHDAGSAYPTNGHQVLGRVLNGGTSAGSFAMMFYPVETEPVPCPTCVTSSASLASNDLVIGAGGQASQTSSLFSVNTGSAELLLGKASTTIGTLGVYGSGSGTPYTLSTNSGATSLTTSGNVILGSIGATNTLTLNSAGAGGITLSPASSSNSTITVPATTSSTDTMAVLGTAQTFSAAQTFSSGITASNLAFNSNGSHIQTNSANNDVAGTATISSGTKTVTVTFTTNYSSKPVCVVTPEADGVTDLFDVWYVTIAVSGGHYPNLVINTHANTNTNVVFDYHCIGNPN